MMVYQNFISEEEAAHFIELAEGRWVPSTVSRGKASVLLKQQADGTAAEKDVEGDVDDVGYVEVLSDTCTSTTVRLDYNESEVVTRSWRASRQSQGILWA